MLKHFISLQWKSFFRSASFQTNVALKILMAFGALYFILVFVALGAGSYYLIEDSLKVKPFDLINRFLIYWVVFDLVIRYFMQKMPVVNIKPLLYLPFKKGNIVNFTLGKTVLSFFNIIHAFFFLPFSVVLVIEGFPVLNVVSWHLAIFALIYANNFINILVNNRDVLFYSIVGILVILGGLQYYGYFDVTDYTAPFFNLMYEQPVFAVLPWVFLIALYFISFNYFKKHLYLDAGLSTKQSEAKTEDLDWLNRFGNLAVFLKNDIKLIKRNKRSRTTVIMSVLFLFYGLLFFTDSIEAYDAPVWKVFAGIFVSGGFLFTFGQFVPSWDSAYYPLMMSQNIRYKEYLDSKWYLIIMATIASTIISSFYIYFGWEAYVAILVGAIYNIGVNSYLVLWGGAYIKTPIDLTTNKKAFGDSQAFNVKTLILTLPKLGLPLVVYAIGHYTINSTAGFILVALTGVLGFAFKNIVFNKIESIYKQEKYKTIAAYKQKN
ncbi:hypothetical protein GWK08_07240 [Leptobacterium flavescens]|uniref:Uncharacterized protein n=1 Tax=Leptobacterium flavescens TaxID=472055 RepID=A0A6P0UMX2_9FLAO|nr:DUF5687 family protein [Leptobacterium flavescens]NER13228.1 hypothetical protein [Leptobacterium flavescens]